MTKMHAQQIDFDKTVISPDSPLATAVAVKGRERVYGFPPRTLITQAMDAIIIRAYGAIFVFDQKAVKVRLLQALTPIVPSTLPDEHDSTILDLIRAARSSAKTHYDVACPDCILPVNSVIKRLDDEQH